MQALLVAGGTRSAFLAAEGLQTRVDKLLFLNGVRLRNGARLRARHCALFLLSLFFSSGVFLLLAGRTRTRLYHVAGSLQACQDDPQEDYGQCDVCRWKHFRTSV